MEPCGIGPSTLAQRVEPSGTGQILDRSTLQGGTRRLWNALHNRRVPPGATAQRVVAGPPGSRKHVSSQIQFNDVLLSGERPMSPDIIDDN